MTKSVKKGKITYYEVPIVGGKLKGKKILIPSLSTTRSSKSILRESLFNTLQFDIIGRNFVEVFAGSGSVGIEAISRGALKGYFLEHNKSAFNALRSNLDHIAPEQSEAIFGDSFELFPQLLKRFDSTSPKTYFYFDPPFSTRDGMEDIYDKTLELISLVDTAYCEEIIVEHMTKLDLPNRIGKYRLRKQKKFGKSSLSYFQPEPAG